jgi:uncharacterized membrane protein YecN with MAPEG domain
MGAVVSCVRSRQKQRCSFFSPNFKQIKSCFRAIGNTLMAIVNGIGNILKAIINGVGTWTPLPFHPTTPQAPS